MNQKVRELYRSAPHGLETVFRRSSTRCEEIINAVANLDVDKPQGYSRYCAIFRDSCMLDFAPTGCL